MKESFICKECQVEFFGRFPRNKELCSLACGKKYVRKHNVLTVEAIRENFKYCPETGQLFRLEKGSYLPVKTRKTVKGYLETSFMSKDPLVHTLAWVLMEGEFPVNQIDHKNQIKDDNRWENLRPATNAQNQYNIGARSSNKSGYKGVTRKTKFRWTASIRVNGNRISLGAFDTAEEAALAYNEAALKLHGEFAYLNEVKEVPDIYATDKLGKRNSAGFLGVYEKKGEGRNRRWVARLQVDGKVYRSGAFYTKEEAAEAYNKLVLQHLGPTGKLNKLPSGRSDRKSKLVLAIR